MVQVMLHAIQLLTCKRFSVIQWGSVGLSCLAVQPT